MQLLDGSCRSQRLLAAAPAAGRAADPLAVAAFHRQCRYRSPRPSSTGMAFMPASMASARSAPPAASQYRPRRRSGRQRAIRIRPRRRGSCRAWSEPVAPASSAYLQSLGRAGVAATDDISSMARAALASMSARSAERTRCLAAASSWRVTDSVSLRGQYLHGFDTHRSKSEGPGLPRRQLPLLGSRSHFRAHLRRASLAAD